MITLRSNKKLLAVIAILFGLWMSTNLPAQDDFGQDPLYNATIHADIEAVKQALASGANINKQGDNGYTCLMWACTYSSTAEYAEVAKLLISKGADVNISANNGTTALIEAASDSKEIVLLLIEKGANIKALRNDGIGVFTRCIFGILSGSVDIDLAEYLLNKGANVNDAATSGDVEGWAAIHYAVSNGDEELVRFLVENGANVVAKTKGGMTPLSLAKSNEYNSIAEILISAGAK